MSPADEALCQLCEKPIRPGEEVIEEEGVRVHRRCLEEDD